ncbi:MAG: CE1759 family FMN reductase, partial [Actinomycetaceae bacterium]
MSELDTTHRPDGPARSATRSIVSISAGTSQPSTTHMLADRLSHSTASALAEQGIDAEVTTIDLRDLAEDALNAMLTGMRTGALDAAMEQVAAADGLVVTSPVYSASYSGLLKIFLDILDAGAIDGTPVLLAATGGTSRHSLAIDHALRPLMSYLRALPVANAVFAATDDWASAGEQGAGERPGEGVGALPVR